MRRLDVHSLRVPSINDEDSTAAVQFMKRVTVGLPVDSKGCIRDIHVTRYTHVGSTGLVFAI